MLYLSLMKIINKDVFYFSHLNLLKSLKQIVIFVNKKINRKVNKLEIVF